MRKIGGHVSVAGRLSKGIDNAIRIGANCIQIFSSPPLQWLKPRYTFQELQEFRKLSLEKVIRPVFVHGTYLVNLATDNPETLRLSKESLIGDLEFCGEIGSPGVIFHLGSHQSKWNGIKREQLITAFREILEETPIETTIFIENSAGSGWKIGTTLEELQIIKEDLNSPRIRFCLDTAHAFAAGYDLRTAACVASFMDQVGGTLGWNSIGAIHLNDSKVGLGKRSDRHENIGKGMIGLEGLKAFVRHPAIVGIPLLLEVPGFSDNGPDKENIAIVQNFFTA